MHSQPLLLWLQILLWSEACSQPWRPMGFQWDLLEIHLTFPECSCLLASPGEVKGPALGISPVK